MDHVTIDELVIPTAVDAPGWRDFAATIDVRNAVEASGYGTHELDFSAAELLPGWLEQEHEPKRLFAARVGGPVVGLGVWEAQADESSPFAWLDVRVHPAWRNRGVGTALADRVEAVATARGQSARLAYAVSPQAPGERLVAPTGFGSVPLANSEVAFLLGRGYRLEQVERGSRLALPVAGERLGRMLGEALARAGPDYAVRLWRDRTPQRWREDLALLYTRMSTDAPTAGLEEPEDVWSVRRLLDHERLQAEGPRTTLVAAAEHLPSGRLAGFTELSVPSESARAVSQEDTLVLREHRGHRLGMLLKLANLEQLARERPGHPSVITFNAEENRHMLDVNEAIGFVPIGYEGAWKRVAG